jgi:hypothetical protein
VVEQTGPGAGAPTVCISSNHQLYQGKEEQREGMEVTEVSREAILTDSQLRSVKVGHEAGRLGWRAAHGACWVLMN